MNKEKEECDFRNEFVGRRSKKKKWRRSVL